MKVLLKRTFIVAAIAVVLHSCTDDYFEFDDINTQDWRPELAMPLIKSSLTLEDIIITNDSNGIIQEDPNTGILQVVYDGRVFSTQGGSVIDLPTQSFDERFSAPAPLPSGGGTQQETFNTTLTFDDGGSSIEVDSLLMKAGQLVLNIENEFEHNVLVTAKFPTFRNSTGKVLELDYDIPPFTGGQVPLRSRIADLTDYTLDMTNGGTTFSEIPVEVEMTFNLIAGNTSSPSDELIFKGEMRNLDFREFSGYIGNTTLDLDQDTIKVNLFENFLDAEFFLSNPLLDITVLNSFGLPTNMTFNQLFAVNPDRSPTDKNIDLPPTAQPIELNYPDGLGVENTLVRLDTNSSNIDEVISFLLQEIVYNATAEFNPTNDRNIRNFVTDTSEIGLDVFLRIPFSGYATGFTVQDTIDFEFENSDVLDSGLVRVNVTNGFPMKGDLQIFFVDESYNTLEVLFVDDNGVATPEQVIDAAPVDAIGNVINPVNSRTDGEFTRERLENLKKSKFAIVRAEMESGGASNQEIVSFKSGYKLDIAVGLKARILIE